MLKEHPILLNDIQNGRLMFTDLDRENPLDPKSCTWIWTPTEELGWKFTPELLQHSLDEVKIRYSPYYHCDVVLMTASREWTGIAEYPSGKCLWEERTPHCPHSVELLPNGDLIMAGSGCSLWHEGRIMYYPLTWGDKCRVTDEAMLPGAHGVVWDPEYELLWAWGYTGMSAYKIVDSPDGPKFSKVEGLGGMSPTEWGHDLMPDYSDRDKLWATTVSAAYQYSKSRNEILTSFRYSDFLATQTNIKGIQSFSDGVAVFCAYNDNVGPYDYTDTITAIWPKEDGSYEVRYYRSTDSAKWNKVRVFSKTY